MEIAVSKNSTGDDAVYQLLSEKDSTCTISVDENIEAVVVVELDPAVESAVITTSVASHADLTLVCVQSPLAVHQTISQANTVQEGAKLQCQNITLGSHVEHAVVSHLRGDHATSSVDWISYAHKKETQNISAENVFCAANGGGEITMKSVAEDTAHLQCNGMINIEEHGGGTDTYLTEEVLMLDPTCTVDAIPGLEIKTNDVKASHSATVSKVTQENLFYFAARGIPDKTARRMYVLGFLGSILDRIHLQETRQALLDSIEEKYHRN